MIKFPLGHVVATANALRVIEEVKGDEQTEAYICRLLDRHMRGDWGEVHPGDVGMNDQALIDGDRLLSVYKDGPITVWIITEWDRSVTTVLLPEDY